MTEIDLLSLPLTTAAVMLAVLAVLAVWPRSRGWAVVFLIWVALLILVDRVGGFPVERAWVEGDVVRFVIFGAVISAPVAVYLLGHVIAPELSAGLARVPVWALTAVSFYRLGGVVFLLAWAEGVFPPQIALSAGVLDLAIALTAMPVAYLLYRGRARSVAVGWNLVVLADFAWAILMVAVFFLGLWAMQPAPTAIGQSPFTLYALFQTPFSIILHLEILRRLASPVLEAR